MESRVLRNVNTNVIKVEDNLPGNLKKRRAAFEDLTNEDGVSFVDNKKKCLKKDPSLQKQTATDNKKVLKAEPVVIHKDVQIKAEPVPVFKKDSLQNVEPMNVVKNISSETVAVEVLPISKLEITQQIKETEEDFEDKINELSDMLDWINVDQENESVPFHVTEYVNDIFTYYREREALFAVADYMPRQSEATVAMRAILVDWMDEIQQGYELIHETLYLAVKLVDLYLDKKNVAKDRLQLLAATAVNIASKYEERYPAMVDDYLFSCDDAYTREEMLQMERDLLITIDFDVGIPLSYTFLRRYAQCARVSIKTLTCARYILETSLMDYSFVQCKESMMAAVCLFLAMTMNHDGNWDATVTHYTGYHVSQLASLARKLNNMLVLSPHPTQITIKTKYSHEVFHEVAKIKPLSETELERLLSDSSRR